MAITSACRYLVVTNRTPIPSSLNTWLESFGVGDVDKINKSKKKGTGKSSPDKKSSVAHHVEVCDDTHTHTHTQNTKASPSCNHMGVKP